MTGRGDEGDEGATDEPREAEVEETSDVTPIVASDPDAPTPTLVRPISGSAVVIRPPAEFETLLGTADEITIELPETLDIYDLVRGTTIAGHVLLTRHSDDVLGPIYAAYDGTRDRKVALRLLPFDLVDPQMARQNALVESLAAIARISHPCIVPVHAVGQWTGGVYVAMEFVEGIDLRTWIEARDEPFPWREVLRVFREVGRAVVAAHAAGVLHRDLSPDKILIGEGGQIRVVDFGLAPTTDVPEDDLELTLAALEPLRERLGLEPAKVTPTMVGTLDYAAPEVLAGGAADRKSDQFSFCVALYETLYGERPFDGTDRISLAAEYVHGEPRPAPPGARIPQWLRAAVVRGLAIRPADRWPTMEQLVRELDRDPAASLRRWQRGLAAVTVVASAAAFIAWQAERAEAKCARTDESFNGVWDQTRRGDLEQAFIASGAPYAAQNFTATAEIIDAWADTWIDEQVAVCEAARIGAASDEIYAERRGCLDARQGELKALLTVLESGDRATLDRAALGAESLTPTRVCTRPAGLAELRYSVDADVGQIAAQAELRERIDRGWVLLRLGRAAAAGELVAADVGEELRHPGLQVAVLHLRGAVANALRQHHEAESLLHEAALRATRDGLDQSLVLISIDLAHALAGQPERYVEASRTLEQTGAVIERARFDEERWRLAVAQGDVSAAAGKAADALPHYHRALAELDRTSEHPWARMELLMRTGELIAAQGDPTAALGYLQRAYDGARDRFGARHPALAEVLLRIGDLRSQQREGVEARTSWERALALVSDAHGPSSSATTKTMLDIARRLRDDVDPTGALEYDRRALDSIDRGGDESLRGAALLDHGRSLLALNRDREAEVPLRQAFEIHDAMWRTASKTGPVAARRGAAAQWVDATVLLARALSSDPSSRDRAILHGRAARAVALEHGLELDPWVLELTRRDPSQVRGQLGER